MSNVDFEATIDPCERFEALGEEFLPKGKILGIARVQSSRLPARLDRHVGMFRGQFAQARVLVDGIAFGDLAAQFLRNGLLFHA